VLERFDYLAFRPAAAPAQGAFSSSTRPVPGMLPIATAPARSASTRPGAPRREAGLSCRHLLGEPLRLPGLPTWWCGDPAQRDAVLERFD
jgi:hypothetical protein